MHFVDSLDIHASTKHIIMSLPLTEVQRYGASVIRCSKHSNAIEIRDRTTFDFYTGLPHMVLIQTSLSESHASELNSGLEGV